MISTTSDDPHNIIYCNKSGWTFERKQVRAYQQKPKGIQHGKKTVQPNRSQNRVNLNTDGNQRKSSNKDGGSVGSEAPIGFG
jgi:hypothetical protein